MRWRLWWRWQSIKLTWRRWRCSHEWLLPERPERPCEVAVWGRMTLPAEDGTPLYESVLPPTPTRFGVAGGNVLAGAVTTLGVLVDFAWMRASGRGPAWRPAVCRRCHAILLVEEEARRT